MTSSVTLYVGYDVETLEKCAGDWASDGNARFDGEIVNPLWLIRRINITANNTKHVIENMKQKTGSIKFWEEMPQKDGI